MKTPTKTIDAARLRIFKMFATDQIDEETAEKFLMFFNHYEHPIFLNDYKSMLENFLAFEIEKYGKYDEETFSCQIVYPERRFCIARDYINNTCIVKNNRLVRLADISNVDIDWLQLLSPKHIIESIPYLIALDADLIKEYLKEPKYKEIVSTIDARLKIKAERE